MFHLMYKIVENDKDAGYLCIEENTYKIIAWNKTDIVKLVRNGLIFGCVLKDGNVANKPGYAGLSDVNRRSISLNEVKTFVRYRNGLCNARINGITVRDSEVRIAVEFRLEKCSREHRVGLSIRNMVDDIRSTGGKVAINANSANYIVVNCNTSQLTTILNSDACEVTYSEPNMIMKSIAPAEWKRKCCEWLKMYAMAIDGVAAEAKRSPYAQLVSPAILYTRFPACKNDIRIAMNELGGAGLVRVEPYIRNSNV